ncbi:hypothetical protein N7457_004486 [Penicillium paradoxum]|uniref:uncharacterized protein n=1 Tax=Penicillium paradoxum TaxID=176176 RepID=UPI0025484A25|nr:uncharacterized protein N7457_004486 [Penicillium paradoxum]KAJ5782712.1 hypothetical protein N7457_004486 [Penicillium paradoxum]
MRHPDSLNHQSRGYLANHAISKQDTPCDHEEWQGWLFQVRETPLSFGLELEPLTSRVIDKDYPLTGVVICFTSVQIERRTPLTQMAEQMGAMHSIHLTSDVTHLLVGDTNSDKYKFVARERNDVLAMNPEWIEAVRQSWTQGEDIDIQALEKQYRLSTLHGLKICITGFSDLPFRAHMQKTTEANGAEYRKDLTKTVTHLIARTSEGDKYKFATQWNIKVVSVKWFEDSIERGMILDEQKYHPLIPPEEQGVGAWDRSLPAEREPSRSDNPSIKENPLNPRPRKLRRIASTKLVDQNESIWGDIVGTGFENNGTGGAKQTPQGRGEAPKPVIQAYQSFASETTLSESAEAHIPPPVAPSKDNGYLHLTYFFIDGFSPKQTKILREHLTFNGAQLVNSLNEFASPSIPKTGHGLFIMVPYQTPSSEVPSTDEMAFECEIVTEMWLERCIDARAFIPPESHVASTPFPKFPISGFSELRICSTGFGGIDLLHVRKLVELMGATYGDYLTPKASVLICNDPQTASLEKLRHTNEWGVPAVSADWLWISIQAGQKKSFEPYIVKRKIPQSASSADKLGSLSAKRKQPHGHIDERRADSPFNISTESTNGSRPERRDSGKSTANQTTPIVGDGFEADAPKPSVPESRSPSPTRNPDKRDASQESNAKQPAPNTEPVPPIGPSALDTALSGFLQQARAAKSRLLSESTTTNDDGNPPRRRRKPLLGRAPSHSSVRMIEGQRPVSRASSIDTLNDDGLGNVLESAHPTRDNSISRSNSRAEQSLSSMLSGGKFDFLNDKLPAHAENEDEENQEPQMTQLDYEDPDAAAMRAELLRDAGKLSGKTATAASSGVIVGEMRELEDIGWASGRRTRRHPVKLDDE